VAALIAEARRTRTESVRLRHSSVTLRARARRAVRRSEQELATAGRLRLLVIRSPWSELQWHVPGRDVDDVLVDVSAKPS